MSGDDEFARYYGSGMATSFKVAKKELKIKHFFDLPWSVVPQFS
jgi:hypothetical protein